MGSHVSDVLSEKGHDIILFDSKPSAFRRENQKMIIGDIKDERLVCKVTKGADIIYHFAGIVDIDEARKRPLDTIKDNILGTAVILEACRLSKVKRFIFASSIYVYSAQGSFYRSSKQSCELIIENYHKHYGLNFTILRYGSLFGDRAGPGNGIQRLVLQALTKKKVIYWGTGQEVREYIHVTDAAYLSAQILSDKFKNKTVKITGRKAIRSKDLLAMLQGIVKGRIDVEYRSIYERGCPFDPESHYFVSPYSFRPQKCVKLVRRGGIAIGQGLAEYVRKMESSV